MVKLFLGSPVLRKPSGLVFCGAPYGIKIMQRQYMASKRFCIQRQRMVISVYRKNFFLEGGCVVRSIVDQSHPKMQA